jgi:hypothetical protein
VSLDVVHATRAREPIIITQRPSIRTWPALAAPADRRDMEVPAMTSADLRKVSLRSTAGDILRILNSAQARHRDAGEIVAVLTDAELCQWREAVAWLNGGVGRETEPPRNDGRFGASPLGRGRHLSR